LGKAVTKLRRLLVALLALGAVALSPLASAANASANRDAKTVATDVLAFAGVVAAVLVGAVAGLVLLAAIVFRIPGFRRFARWVSKRRWGVRGLYSLRWTAPISALLRVIVRGFDFIAGCHFRIDDFGPSQNGAAAETDAATVTAVARGALGAGGAPITTGGPQFVTATYQSGGALSAVAASLKDIPQLKLLAPLLTAGRALLPRDAYVVQGTLLPAGKRGRGVNLMLEGRSGDVLATETLWSVDYDPPVGGADDGGADPLHRLGVAVAAWTAYRVFEQRETPERAAELGAANWRSYAYFRTALECHLAKSNKKAAVLYARAVDEDPMMAPAQVNLARLEEEAAREGPGTLKLRKLAQERLERVWATKFVPPVGFWGRQRKLGGKTIWDREEKHKAQILRRDTLWYQAAYSLAVVHLSPPAEPHRAYEIAHKLAAETRKSTSELRARRLPHAQRQTLSDFFVQLRAPSLAVLADAALAYGEVASGPGPPADPPEFDDALDSAVAAPLDKAAARALAAAAVAKLTAESPPLSSRAQYNLACYYAAAQQWDDALERLSYGLEQVPPEWARRDPSLERLRRKRVKQFNVALAPYEPEIPTRSRAARALRMRAGAA
jgi:hypothetical protein